MNAPRDPDTILSAWLDEGPDALPDSTRRAIAVATRTTEQKRRSLGASWRNPLMTPLARVAVAAIAVVALAGGAAYILGPGSGVGGTTPTPSPSLTSAPSSGPASPSPQAAVPTDWTTYASSRFAYSIDYPTDWVVTPATKDWPSSGFPEPDGVAVDKFSPASNSTLSVSVSSGPLKAGEVAADRIAELDAFNAPLCQVSRGPDITIDGVSARQEDLACVGTDFVIEVVAARDGRFYSIVLFSTGTREAASVTGQIRETNRGTFDRFLSSFRFGG